MLPMDKLSTPGDHPFFFTGKVGQLEAILTVPLDYKQSYIALLGHPHSLKGGTMSNKVVTTLARAFADMGIASIRFNFRGVGQSEGEYAAGLGEAEDMLVLVELCQKAMPQVRFLFAGFSFGSFVAFLAAQQCPHELLLMVGPAVHHFDYKPLMQGKSLPWVIIQGDKDEVVPPAEVYAFAKSFDPELPLIRFEDTGHFFHGKLTQLKEAFIQAVKEKAIHP